MTTATQTVATLPRLGRDYVRGGSAAAARGVSLPRPELLELPERAVQFGTGAFLRGFVDYFLDAANRSGQFGGRVVAVGSTGSGRDQRLNDQDGLYTLAIRGMEAGRPYEEHRVIASVSRALSARDEWDEVLACARNPGLELVFSNTTEVGIVLDPEDEPTLAPPRSFPGKLTRFLLERARAFDYDGAKGVVVLPCELIERNGDRLREIVLALADRWRLGDAFTRWVETSVPFCNTLVDRIVPGAPAAAEAERIGEALGARDEMITTCEVYRLFAIEADDATRARLRFAAADPGIVLTDDVTPYRERKVRLLNGAHTMMVPAALLAGCESVREAVGHELIGRFVRRAMFDEIAPTLDVPFAKTFASEVLDRFANPFIHHALVDITLQGTMKMRVRVVPAIVRFVERMGRPPRALTLGFAAHLLYLRDDLQERRRREGLRVPADDEGARITERWAALDDESDAALATLARAVCADTSLWVTDLSALPGFVDTVAGHLALMRRDGMSAALERLLAGVAGDAVHH